MFNKMFKNEPEYKRPVTIEEILAQGVLHYLDEKNYTYTHNTIMGDGSHAPYTEHIVVVGPYQFVGFEFCGADDEIEWQLTEDLLGTEAEEEIIGELDDIYEETNWKKLGIDEDTWEEDNDDWDDDDDDDDDDDWDDDEDD